MTEIRPVTSLKVNHPVHGKVEYRTNGNIKFDGEFKVASTSLPLERIQKSFDEGFNFSQTLRRLFNV